ncbi:MAG: hypothetical protein K9I74_01665 [Bacteroidales bacterium]|nr:hypothetical protein [Bacteroidales bacterium]
MKKYLFLLLLFSFANVHVFSQDLIVTNEEDSINCRITEVKENYIYFTFKSNDEFRSTLIPISDTKHHQKDYFKESEVPKEKLIGYKDYERFIIGASGGYSYRIGKIKESLDPEAKDYLEELKSGYHFGGDFYYFFTEEWGIGFEYYLYKASNSTTGQYGGKISDDITISFIGPTVSQRIFNHDKSNAFRMNLALGYMDFKNKIVRDENYTLTGNTSVVSLGVGYDIGLSENLALGFKVEFFQGGLFEMVKDDGQTKETIDPEKGESLHRLDFSVGLRFRK